SCPAPARSGRAASRSCGPAESPRLETLGDRAPRASTAWPCEHLLGAVTPKCTGVHRSGATPFALAHQRPPTLAGIRARLAATVALHTFCCWLNQQLGRPVLALADFMDC